MPLSITLSHGRTVFSSARANFDHRLLYMHICIYTSFHMQFSLLYYNYCNCALELKFRFGFQFRFRYRYRRTRVKCETDKRQNGLPTTAAAAAETVATAAASTITTETVTAARQPNLHYHHHCVAMFNCHWFQLDSTSTSTFSRSNGLQCDATARGLLFGCSALQLFGFAVLRLHIWFKRCWSIRVSIFGSVLPLLRISIRI